MKLLSLTLVLPALVFTACASDVDNAALEPEAGYYDVINSNGGVGYPDYCYDLACSQWAAVRLLQQYVGAGESARAYACVGTDKASACRDQAGHKHAVIHDCDKDAHGWTCGMSVGEPEVDLGTVRLEHPAYRFEFWDGSIGLGSTVSHSFEVLPSRESTFLPR